MNEEHILDEKDEGAINPKDIIWEGCQDNRFILILFFFILLSSSFEMIYYVLGSDVGFLDSIFEYLNENRFNFFFLVYWMILFSIFLPFYVRKINKYWLLTNGIAMRLGVKRKFYIFYFDEMEKMNIGLYADMKIMKGYTTFHMKPNVKNQFSTFLSDPSKIRIGRIKNNKLIYEKMKKQFDLYKSQNE